MAKKKPNRHFSTTHHPKFPNHPPPPQHHHHYRPHHPYNHQPQPINHQAQFQSQSQSQSQPNHPFLETTLINEVLYLHSLWHRGPPSAPTNITNPYLKPNPTTHFKKTRPGHVSGKEWPAPEPAPDPHSGPEWPAFRGVINPNTRPATDEERARVLGGRVQLRAVEACSCLFRSRNEDESDEEEEEEDDGDDEEEIDFFENLFEEDKELREFYLRNCEGLGGGGEFCCLVCGGNLGRKFKNCVALVQHSITVSKTKRKKAHRAYGNVVCKVLGWDVDRLPSLPLSAGVAGLDSVGKPSEVIEGEVKNNADGGSAGVEVETNAALAEPSQTEMETIPDATETENATSTDVGCPAAELNPGLRKNDPELDQQEVVNKNEEGCPVPESKPVQCESTVADDDPFEQLPCLQGAFQIPE